MSIWKIFLAVSWWNNREETTPATIRWQFVDVILCNVKSSAALITVPPQTQSPSTVIDVITSNCSFSHWFGVRLFLVLGRSQVIMFGPHSFCLFFTVTASWLHILPSFLINQQEDTPDRFLIRSPSSVYFLLSLSSEEMNWWKRAPC